MIRETTRPSAGRSSRRPAARLLVAVVLLLAAGCNAVGPRAVRTGRAAYNEAVVRTWNEQLLLNLVRLRYRDTPFFLEITSVSTQYSLHGSAASGAIAGSGDDGVNLGLGVDFSESPTITYVPVTGEEFVRQLLTPIPLETLFLLPQAGWSVERVLLCCVQRLNDLPNAPAAAGPTPEYVPPYERFHRAAELLRRLQVAGHLELGLRPAAPGGGSSGVEYVLRLGAEDGAAEVAELRDLLALSATDRDVLLTPGALDRPAGEAMIYPRSLIGVLFFLSQAVEPPPEHAEDGLVTVTRTPAGEPFAWSEVTGDLLRIRSGAQAPEGAFVAVPYRGHWYWIADDDLNSKTTFGLLTQLYSLQSGDRSSSAPLLTLPVGG
ncbi:MAG TPA: hypothetical protein VHQ65_15925 [Thermoanaerobaculia bacterium]|nr:hypothetical protein [Thermoanaerobaculia bacterium]